MSIELGGVLVGIAAIITAIGGLAVDARRRSRRAEEHAEAALAASPTAIMEGFRTEVQAVVDAYHESLKRWTADRNQIEEDRDRERTRADAAEAVVLTLRGELAVMRIDLAAARAEVADLSARVESAFASRR